MRMQMTGKNLPEGVEIRAEIAKGFEEILTPRALAFIAKLHREFNGRGKECLQRRQDRQARLDGGESLDFLTDTKQIRDGNWTCASIPADLRDRRVEITGPTDRKMVINALNCGAKTFMADFEDANSPTWPNLIGGQVNLIDAVNRTIAVDDPNGRSYRLNEETATLLIRPRGWHLVDRHLLIDGRPVSAS